MNKATARESFVLWLDAVVIASRIAFAASVSFVGPNASKYWESEVFCVDAIGGKSGVTAAAHPSSLPAFARAKQVGLARIAALSAASSIAQDSVTADAVVSWGVTPLVTAIVGVMVPKYRTFPAPLARVPTAQ